MKLKRSDVPASSGRFPHAGRGRGGDVTRTEDVAELTRRLADHISGGWNKRFF